MVEQSIQAMCRDHFNEPIICSSEIVRLIGYGETAIDCYLICSSTKRVIYWNSAVGGYTFLGRLKGQRHVRSADDKDWDDFVRLDSLLELNGAPKVKDFIVDLRPDDYEGRILADAVLITEPKSTDSGA